MTRPFRFGVSLRDAGSCAEWHEKARRAEALGYSIAKHTGETSYESQYSGPTVLDMSGKTVPAVRSFSRWRKRSGARSVVLASAASSRKCQKSGKSTA